jgi:hypothetical protein
MRSRRLLPLLLASALAAPLTAAEAAPRSHVLAGTVRISTSTSASMVVRLPKPAKFTGPFQAPAGTSVKGDGRIVGVALYDVKKGPPSFDAIRFNWCDQPGCAGTSGYTFFHAHDGNDQHAPVLPAGDYRLVVVTDGKRVDITLKFPGVPGSVTLNPTGRVQVKHLTQDYEWVAPGAPFGTAYTTSSDYAVDGGDAILLHQFQVQTDVSVQQSHTFCAWHPIGVEQPAPECPGDRTTRWTTTDVQQEPRYSRSGGIDRYFDEGRWRAGSFYRTVGEAHDPIGSLAWVVVPRG